MPQLDKYIYLNHVITLTVFFGLIYMFLRQSVIPYTSTTLKYRAKKTKKVSGELDSLDKVISSSKSEVARIGKSFGHGVVDRLNIFGQFYKDLSANKLDLICKASSDVRSK